MLDEKITVINRIKNIPKIIKGEWLLHEELSIKGKHLYIEDEYGICKMTKHRLITGTEPNIKSAINKTEYYINKVVKKRGYFYNYDKVNYINNFTNIEIVCPKHGSFFQTPKNHLQNEHCCPKCSSKKIYRKPKLTFDNFKEEAKTIHKYKFIYNSSTFKNIHIKIPIVCPIHGEFLQTPKNHLIGKGCKKCENKKEIKNYILNRNYLIKQLLLKNKYFLGGEFKIIKVFKKRFSRALVESKYGICDVAISSLLRGTKPTIESAIDKVNYFKNKAIEKHGDLYDYSNITKYRNSKDILPISCKYHGVFTQTAPSHLSGSGCPRCNHISYQYSKWAELGKKSKNFKGFKLYIVKVYDNDEKFYKIGKTYTTLELRFNSIPYNFDIVYSYESDAISISKIEKILHREYHKYKYIPLKKFGGDKECFKQLPNTIDKKVQKIIKNGL